METVKHTVDADRQPVTEHAPPSHPSAAPPEPPSWAAPAPTPAEPLPEPPSDPQSVLEPRDDLAAERVVAPGVALARG